MKHAEKPNEGRRQCDANPRVGSLQAYEERAWQTPGGRTMQMKPCDDPNRNKACDPFSYPSILTILIIAQARGMIKGISLYKIEKKGEFL